MKLNHKYFFPIHLDGGNRGCEGIAKGTAEILGEPKDNLIGLCRNIDLDTKLGIRDYITLQPYHKKSYLFHIVDLLYNKICCVLRLDKYTKSLLAKRYQYNPFINQMKSSDYLVSTGGDMMCYSDNQVIYTNEYCKKKGFKTILWGCSMGKENLTQRKLKTLKKFDLIYVRETLSYEFFKSLGLKNIVCLPDPAFVLSPEEVPLPDVFKMGDVIGINLSNYVLGGYSLDTPFGMQVKTLIDYILNETKLQILLIPHVTWSNQDDRVTAQNVKEIYGLSERIHVLNIDKMNYCQIRYVISKCKFFIGGRTHAVISAYSTCVPTLALGYSIKSLGIAKDLGLSEKLVVNSKKSFSNNELLESFLCLIEKEEEVRKHLIEIMDDYKEKPYEMRQIINFFQNDSK